MVITTMVLCASLLALGDFQESANKPDVKQNQNAEQTASSDIAKGNPQAAETANKDPQPATSQPEMEEKEINGVKLLAIEANIVSYTNEERARYGLPPLAVDKELMQTAREHCAWMTRNHSMVHTQRAVAENVPMGQPHSSDVVRAVDAIHRVTGRTSSTAATSASAWRPTAPRMAQFFGVSSSGGEEVTG